MLPLFIHYELSQQYVIIIAAIIVIVLGLVDVHVPVM